MFSLRGDRAIRFLSWVVFLQFMLPVGARGEISLEPTIGDLLETYRHLHAHPELSYQEEATSRFLAGRLQALGFEVTESVGTYRDGSPALGVVALLRNGEGPTLMIRTDMDALPVIEKTGLPYASQVEVTLDSGEHTGVMHACGHDMHMTVFLGTAQVLAQNRDAWQGTLMLVAQPAEERGAGALAMLQDGLYERFARPDYALAYHVSAELPAGRIGYRPGYALASVDSVDIAVRGVGGHGAYPHKTLDPIVLASQMVLGFQTIVSRQVSPLDSAVVTVGSFQGGTKHNVIPDQVDLQLTVRSYEPSVRSRVLDSIRQIARGSAEAAGIPEELHPLVEIAEEEHTPATYNDPELTRRVTGIFKTVLGEENVVEVDPVMAGEDFSRYGGESSVKSSLFWLGGVDPAKVEASMSAGETLPPLHSPLFAPLPEPTIRAGVRAMAQAALALLER